MSDNQHQTLYVAWDSSVNEDICGSLSLDILKSHLNRDWLSDWNTGEWDGESWDTRKYQLNEGTVPDKDRVQEIVIIKIPFIRSNSALDNPGDESL